MNKPVLVIIAAGLSSRYGKGTKPKQIDPVGPGGEVIIDYSVYDAIRAGFSKVVFVIKREMEADFRRAIGDKVANFIKTEYAFQDLDDLPSGFAVPAERTKPWGTAHAVMAARRVVDEPFAVVGADDFFGLGTFRVLCDYLTGVDPASSDFAMAGFIIENTVTPHGHVSRGVCTAEGEYLKSVVERKFITLKPDGHTQYSLDRGATNFDIPHGSIVSMNTWAFTPRIFTELERGFREFFNAMETPRSDEYGLSAAVDDFIHSKKATVRILETSERWYGVTWQEDKPFIISAIADMTARGIYPARLWQNPVV